MCSRCNFVDRENLKEIEEVAGGQFKPSIIQPGTFYWVANKDIKDDCCADCDPMDELKCGRCLGA